MTKDTDSSPDETTKTDETCEPDTSPQKQAHSIMLNMSSSIYSYEGKDIDMLVSSNYPHVNVEDGKCWKSYKDTDGNPNLIGQIHFMSKDSEHYDEKYLEPRFHLCYNPGGKTLTKSDLLAIVKMIDELQKFKDEKVAQHKKLDRKK